MCIYVQWNIRGLWNLSGILEIVRPEYHQWDYPLINVQLWKITMFNGKIHYQWAVVNSYVNCPEGKLYSIDWFKGKKYRNIKFFMGKSMVSSRFPLKSTH